jgi:hypothetical protein
MAPVSMAIFAGVQGPLVMTTAWSIPSAASSEQWSAKAPGPAAGSSRVLIVFSMSA